MRPPRTRSAGSQATSMTQTGQSRRPRGHQEQHRHAGHRALGQIECDNASSLVQPTDRDLKDPVEVDPGDPLSRECEDIGPRDLAHLADQVAGSEVPVDVGVLERKHAQKEGEDQGTARPGPRRPATPRRSGIPVTRPGIPDAAPRPLLLASVLQGECSGYWKIQAWWGGSNASPGLGRPTFKDHRARNAGALVRAIACHRLSKAGVASVRSYLRTTNQRNGKIPRRRLARIPASCLRPRYAYPRFALRRSSYRDAPCSRPGKA